MIHRHLLKETTNSFVQLFNHWQNILEKKKKKKKKKKKRLMKELYMKNVTTIFKDEDRKLAEKYRLIRFDVCSL